MGYYVNIDWMETTNDIFIKSENYVEAYNNLCWLNTNPDFDILKRGGSFGGENQWGIDSRSARPSELDYHPAKWFSWMKADYHKHASTLIEILSMVGFSVMENERGIQSFRYSDKTGCEETFLCALAPFIESESHIYWSGEDGDKWKNSFTNGKMFYHKAKTIYAVEGDWINLAKMSKYEQSTEEALLKLMENN
jgi:hypothetical protein